MTREVSQEEWHRILDIERRFLALNDGVGMEKGTAFRIELDNGNVAVVSIFTSSSGTISVDVDYGQCNDMAVERTLTLLEEYLHAVWEREDMSEEGANHGDT